MTTSRAILHVSLDYLSHTFGMMAAGTVLFAAVSSAHAYPAEALMVVTALIVLAGMTRLYGWFQHRAGTILPASTSLGRGDSYGARRVSGLGTGHLDSDGLRVDGSVLTLGVGAYVPQIGTAVLRSPPSAVELLHGSSGQGKSRVRLDLPSFREYQRALDIQLGQLKRMPLIRLQSLIAGSFVTHGRLLLADLSMGLLDLEWLEAAPLLSIDFPITGPEPTLKRLRVKMDAVRRTLNQAEAFAVMQASRGGSAELQHLKRAFLSSFHEIRGLQGHAVPGAELRVLTARLELIEASLVARHLVAAHRLSERATGD